MLVNLNLQYYYKYLEMSDGENMCFKMKLY